MHLKVEEKLVGCCFLEVSIPCDQKAIRVWVESVVRFSLPAAFEVYLIKPDRRYMEKIRAALHDLFRDLVAEGVLEMEKDGETAPGMPSFASEELYPYVQAELSLGKMI